MLEIFSKNLYFRGDKLKKIYIDARTSYGRVRISTKLEKTRKNELFVLENIDEFIYGHFNQVAPNVKLTISRVAQEVLKECQNIKRSTLNQYQTCIRRILKYFGNVNFKTLNDNDLNQFVANLALSRDTTKLTIGFFNRLIHFANTNAGTKLKPLELKKAKLMTEPKEAKPLNLDEIKLVLKTCKNKEFRNYLIVAFFTGARSNEILALQWKDFDFENNKIKINKTLNAWLEITQPKTKDSNREIEMLPIVKEALLAQRELTPSGAKFVFGDGFKPVRLLRYRVMWEKLLSECGLEFRVLYNTRHTFASLMLQQGEEALWVSQMLGHKNLNITFERYAKFLPSARARAGFIDFGLGECK